jgi:hypothetical protein
MMPLWCWSSSTFCLSIEGTHSCVSWNANLNSWGDTSKKSRIPLGLWICRWTTHHNFEPSFFLLICISLLGEVKSVEIAILYSDTSHKFYVVFYNQKCLMKQL